MTDKRLAFVLMPFDADYEAVYTDLIQAPLTNVGFDVRRADSLQNQRSILHDIVQGIAQADLIIADVSGLNGNVMYELGLAHGLGKRTVLITRSIQELPFDLRPYRANGYSTNFTEAHKLADLLRELGEAVVAGTADFSNPVQDFAPDALMATPQVSASKTSLQAASGEDKGTVAGDPDSDEERGFLELILAMQEGDERAGEVGNSIAQAIDRIGTQVQAHGARLDNASRNLGDKAVTVAVGIARDVANDLNTYSDTIGPLIRELESAMRDITSGADAIARDSQITDSADLEALETSAARLAELEDSMAGALEGVSGFAQTLTDLPNMESSLRKASRRAGVLSGELASKIEFAQSEFARARAVMVERSAEARRRLNLK